MKLLKQISVFEFENEFLKSEFYSSRYDQVRKKVKKAILDTNYKNPVLNAIRHLSLYTFRGRFLSTLPKNIKFYIAEIDKSEFFELKVINEYSWTCAFGNENRHMSQISNLINIGVKDAIHVPKILEISNNISKHNFSNKLILLKKGANGLPVVFEGNHRAISFFMNLEKIKSKFPLKVIVIQLHHNSKCVWL